MSHQGQSSGQGQKALRAVARRQAGQSVAKPLQVEGAVDADHDPGALKRRSAPEHAF